MNKVKIKVKYELCKQCNQFIEENYFGDDELLSVTETTVTLRYGTFCRYVHLCDDEEEIENDHDATPSGNIKTLEEWKISRPDLFPVRGQMHLQLFPTPK